MSYGPSHPAIFRRAGTFIHKILKGAKPADGLHVLVVPPSGLVERGLVSLLRARDGRLLVGGVFKARWWSAILNSGPLLARWQRRTLRAANDRRHSALSCDTNRCATEPCDTACLFLALTASRRMSAITVASSANPDEARTSPAPVRLTQW
jgi:hypothetical protein